MLIKTCAYFLIRKGIMSVFKKIFFVGHSIIRRRWLDDDDVILNLPSHLRINVMMRRTAYICSTP